MTAVHRKYAAGRRAAMARKTRQLKIEIRSRSDIRTHSGHQVCADRRSSAEQTVNLTGSNQRRSRRRSSASTRTLREPRKADAPIDAESRKRKTVVSQRDGCRRASWVFWDFFGGPAMYACCVTRARPRFEPDPFGQLRRSELGRRVQRRRVCVQGAEQNRGAATGHAAT